MYRRSGTILRKKTEDFIPELNFKIIQLGIRTINGKYFKFQFSDICVLNLMHYFILNKLIYEKMFFKKMLMLKQFLVKNLINKNLEFKIRNTKHGHFINP
jgi:hypothetical protein